MPICTPHTFYSSTEKQIFAFSYESWAAEEPKSSLGTDSMQGPAQDFLGVLEFGEKLVDTSDSAAILNFLYRFKSVNTLELQV